MLSRSGEGEELSYLRWSTHCTTRPKVPSPKVLTISSEMKESRVGEREGEKGGNELNWKKKGCNILG
jgi:hypothetical protein